MRVWFSWHNFPHHAMPHNFLGDTQDYLTTVCSLLDYYLNSIGSLSAHSGNINRKNTACFNTCFLKIWQHSTEKGQAISGRKSPTILGHYSNDQGLPRQMPHGCFRFQSLYFSLLNFFMKHKKLSSIIIWFGVKLMAPEKWKFCCQNDQKCYNVSQH